MSAPPFSNFMTADLQAIQHPLLEQNEVELTVKRDDLLHPVISGNKAYKLKYNLDAAIASEAPAIATFGGAFSNHLHATAYAAKQQGIPSIGIIRGEQILPLNATLKDCVAWGMTLHPVSRLDYQNKNTIEFQQRLESVYGEVFWVPEGGANAFGVKGASDILLNVDQSQFDYVIAACGTGTTLAGLIEASEPHVNVVGVPVLKNADWMYSDIAYWLSRSNRIPASSQCHWELWLDYHFGGYAKRTKELNDFIVDMSVNGLPLDFVYTGKALYGVFEKIRTGEIPKGSRVLFCHTGGLQGMRSLL